MQIKAECIFTSADTYTHYLYELITIYFCLCYKRNAEINLNTINILKS